MSNHLKLSDEVAEALAGKRPIVALESTVIAHGLPYPQNLETAQNVENIIRENGAVPATIAVFDGQFCVGLNQDRIEQLSRDKTVRKLSRRDLAAAVAGKLNGATTVAATSFVAHRAGIRVFATGGIGGVHRGFSADVSADLPELAQTPITVVCSGAKIVLDLPATREWLETYGVSVLGYRCSEIPAFYGRTSGLAVDERVETVEEAAQIINARDELSLPGAILLTVPVPREFEIEPDRLERVLHESISEAGRQQITGKRLTPFLLARMSEMSAGKTLAANVALLENNAFIATQTAVCLHKAFPLS